MEITCWAKCINSIIALLMLRTVNFHRLSSICTSIHAGWEVASTHAHWNRWESHAASPATHPEQWLHTGRRCPASGFIQFQVMPLKNTRPCLWTAHLLRIATDVNLSCPKLTWAIKHIARQMPICNEVVQLASENTPIQSYIDYWSEFWVSAICQLNGNLSFSSLSTTRLHLVNMFKCTDYLKKLSTSLIGREKSFKNKN